MLHKELEIYLRAIDVSIRRLEDVYVERYEEEVLTPTRITLRIRVRFKTGALLELNEAVICVQGQTQHLSYRYHFQDRQNCLIFRYDNTPHFQALEGFPHHKHLPDGVIGCVRPDIMQVVSEAHETLKKLPPLE